MNTHISELRKHKQMETDVLEVIPIQYLFGMHHELVTYVHVCVRTYVHTYVAMYVSVNLFSIQTSSSTSFWL